MKNKNTEAKSLAQMPRLSNCLFIILNIAALASAIFCVSTALDYQIHSIDGCQHAIKTPLMVMGIFFIVTPLIGLISALCNKDPFLLWIYSFLMALSFVGLLLFLVFVLLVTKPGAGKTFDGIRFKEYALGDYSSWLRRQVADGKKWDGIRSCLIEYEACSRLTDNGELKDEKFFNMKLSPIESGCCKPPLYCGFQHENATYWTAPKSGPAVQDPDCNTWSNNQDKLCYDCDSCKGGVAASFKSRWTTFCKLISPLFLVIAIFYFISRRISINIQKDSENNRAPDC